MSKLNNTRYLVDYFILIDFKENKLDKEEIATFVNYMIEVSANAKIINDILDMNETDLKEKLKELSLLGF